MTRAASPFAAVSLALVRLALWTGLACAPATTPDAPTPLDRPAPNHNRLVGTYTGTTTLPDGRALGVELVLDRDAFASGRYTFDDTHADFLDVPFDLRNGLFKLGNAVSVPITPEGTNLVLHGFPTTSGWTRVFVRTNGAETPVDVNLTREHEPIGGDNRATILDPTEDANVDTTPVTFAALVTEYAVPGPKQGHFSAFGSIDATHDDRRFSLLIDAIDHDGPRDLTFTAPITFPDPDVQLNYNEQQPDGTIRQWTAKSGRLVFDAIDGELVSQSGQESAYGLYTFHFEDVRMEPSNSVSDPRFVGASGAFTFGFSGTSTEGTKYLSR